MEAVKSFATLNEAWDQLEKSPSDDGRVELIVRRPETDQRERNASCQLYGSQRLGRR